MSELMDRAVIGMPFDMAMQNHLSRMQFYNRAKAILAERDALLAERDALQGQLDDLRNGWANSVKAHSEALAERDALQGQLNDLRNGWANSVKAHAALLAERDAAFAAGQRDMRERAAEQCDCALMDWEGDVLHDRARAIRDLPIKLRP